MKAKTLRQFKENKQLTNKQLADMFGVTPVYVAFLLSGKRIPSRNLAQRINEITGIPTLDLLYPNGAQN
jgi:transcriptional regulator with XRE-family HTH domain